MFLFARSSALSGAVAGLMSFGLFVHMAAGGTYAVIPFINKKVLGSVAGIVGAGGNVGAVLAGFSAESQRSQLFASDDLFGGCRPVRRRSGLCGSFL